MTHIDSAGRELEQPGDRVILSAYALGNVHLMVLSGIGKDTGSFDHVKEGFVGRDGISTPSTGGHRPASHICIAISALLALWCFWPEALRRLPAAGAYSA